MRLITRYVLREIFLVFLVTLVSLTLLMVLVGAVREALVQGIGLKQIVLLLPYLLPNALMFAIPGTILFAVSIVYGRMSGANEITALKSLGLSPMILLWPTLMFSSLLSLGTVWLNDLAMSWGYYGVERVVIDALEDIAYGRLRTQKSFGTPAFSVTVRGVEGHKLISPHFSLPAGENSPALTIDARTAELRSSPGSGKLTLSLYHATVDGPGIHGEYPNETIEREIIVNPHAGENNPSAAHLALRQIPEAMARQVENIKNIEQRVVEQVGFQIITGDFGESSGAWWTGEANNLHHQKDQINRMQTEQPRRWANGFSCLCFALVGASMAIRMRNSDALTSFFLCFGPILLVYYPFLFFGVDRAKAGAITPNAVWLANAILVVWGLWLLRRVIRY